MRFIGLVLGTLLLGAGAHAHVHSIGAASQALRAHQADTQLLVYKVKNSRTETMNQGWHPYLSRKSFSTQPVFRRISAMNPREMRALSVRTQQNISEYGRYFVRRYPEPLNEAEALQALMEMYADQNIEFAYFEPKWRDAVMSERMQGAPQAPLSEVEPSDYEAQQFHLNPAPEGVDARFAWTKPGGTGQGVSIIDVETGWHTEHYEFSPVFYDNGKNGLTDHGTAVWGEVAGRPDGKGITGIAYGATWGIAGSGFNGFENYPATIAAVIEDAALQLQAGDLLIIEQHAPLVDDYGPIEYFEPVFKALQLATSKGIHCVAAAGNGYSNLDDPKYQNVFDTNVRDSGCILVGAVDSPKGSRVRQRSDFSNYGKRVDAFGYGEDVVTAGYGDLFSGNFQGKLASYTNQFSGTSSATPIVAGAVASVLGIAKAKGIPLTPLQLREALRATGTAQEGANKANENVGTMPNIPQILSYLKLN